MTSFYEPVDPMLADDSQVYNEATFFSKWPSILADQDGWDWKEMKKRLKEKDPSEKWFVMKSVDTLPSEDGMAPYVPNFICFVQKEKTGELEANAPRLSMKPAVRTPDMDPEAFVADDIVDMKGTHHWRKLENHPNVRVLCELGENTGEKKAFDFSQFGVAAPSASSTDAPASAPASGGFNFGAPAAASTGAAGGSTGFTFGATTAASSSGSTGGGFTFGASSEGASAGGGFNFGGAASSGAASSGGFNFGAPAGGFNFGAPAAAPATGGTGGFNFSSGVGKKRKAEEDAEGQPAAKRFQPPTEEPVFPVLWQETTVEEMEDEMSAGQKVIASHKTDKGTIKMVLECDLDFIEASEAERKAEVQKMIEKFVLSNNAEFKAIREKYEDMPFDGTEDALEKRQEGFNKERATMLARPEIAAEVKAVSESHAESMLKTLVELCEGRKAKLDATRAMLQAIVKERKEGKMLGREHFRIDRIFPEKDSKGEYCAFRPSKRINKSVGKADTCYPEVYKLVNPFTGEVREA